jgi:hypothetical protein
MHSGYARAYNSAKLHDDRMSSVVTTIAERCDEVGGATPLSLLAIAGGGGWEKCRGKAPEALGWENVGGDGGLGEAYVRAKRAQRRRSSAARGLSGGDPRGRTR